MRLKAVFYKVLSIAVVTVMVLAAPQLATLRAQGGLSDEQLALIDRVIAAFDALAQNNYTNVGVNGWSETWKASMDGQVAMGAASEGSTTWEAEIIHTDTSVNLLWKNTTQVKSSQINPPSETSYTLEAEVRVIDGAVYVNAAYVEPSPELPAVPKGWIEVTETSPSEWPGLASLGLERFFDDEPDTISYLNFGVSLEELKTVFVETATVVTSASGTLEDGAPIETIGITLNRDGWLRISPDFDINDPTNRAIFSGLTSSPRTFAFILDESGHLVKMVTDTKLDVLGIDISGIQGAPQGVLLSLNSDSRSINEFSLLTEPLPVIEVPELAAQSAQS
jgi:hypothetical protein